MLFHSPEFLVFSLVLTALLLVFSESTPRKIVLLVASYVFYMWWNPAFIALIFYATFVNYLVGLLLGGEGDARKRKILIVVALLLDLGLLGFFKYAGFFQANLLALMKLAGAEPHWTALQVALPVGISFYTFQAMNYTIDVYRGRIPVCRAPLDFALFVAFFPQLLSGPIARASEFLPQLQRPIQLSFDQRSFLLILKGLVKKVIIADNLAVFVDFVFSRPETMPSLLVWLGAIGFTIQIYCDFSGYTDMAIAIARILGFELPINFDKPFFSGNIAEFWRRWHISLSSWINDYLYTPMALALRGWGTTGIVFSLVVSFLLVGLWHGASWNFVLFGGLHGVALAWEVLTRKQRRRLRKRSNPAVYHAVSVAITLVYICFAFIVFRARDLEAAARMVAKFFVFDFDFHIASLGLGTASMFSSLGLMAAFVALHVFSYRKTSIESYLLEVGFRTRAAVAFGVGIGLVMFWPLSEAPFIYFQF